jgi:hypothetical protein
MSHNFSLTSVHCTHVTTLIFWNMYLSVCCVLVMHYVATDDFCKVKTVYSISITLSKSGFRFTLVILYLSTCIVFL